MCRAGWESARHRKLKCSVSSSPDRSPSSIASACSLWNTRWTCWKPSSSCSASTCCKASYKCPRYPNNRHLCAKVFTPLLDNSFRSELKIKQKAKDVALTWSHHSCRLYFLEHHLFFSQKLMSTVWNKMPHTLFCIVIQNVFFFWGTNSQICSPQALMGMSVRTIMSCSSTESSLPPLLAPPALSCYAVMHLRQC